MKRPLCTMWRIFIIIIVIAPRASRRTRPCHVLHNTPNYFMLYCINNPIAIGHPGISQRPAVRTHPQDGTPPRWNTIPKAGTSHNPAYNPAMSPHAPQSTCQWKKTPLKMQDVAEMSRNEPETKLKTCWPIQTNDFPLGGYGYFSEPHIYNMAGVCAHSDWLIKHVLSNITINHGFKSLTSLNFVQVFKKACKT